MQSIAYYRRLKIDSKEILDEISTMKRALNPDLDGKLLHSKKPFEITSITSFVNMSMLKSLECVGLK